MRKLLIAGCTSIRVAVSIGRMPYCCSLTCAGNDGVRASRIALSTEQFSPRCHMRHTAKVMSILINNRGLSVEPLLNIGLNAQSGGIFRSLVIP
jgi:hypothetical protein